MQMETNSEHQNRTMSPENRGNNLGTPPIYTISPGVYQGNANYGFRPDHPQAPPPRYEDVISGEYLKWKDTSYDHSPSRPDHPTNLTCHCYNSHTPTVPPETVSFSEENTKGDFWKGSWAAVFALFILGIFIWRVTRLT